MTNSAASPSPDRARKNEMLGDEITLLAGQLDAGSYRMIKLIAEFDEHKAWGDGGGVEILRPLAELEMRHCHGSGPGESAGGALSGGSAVDRCLFATGEISYSKVRAMTRVATPETEEALLEFARHGTASHVEQLVSKYKRVKAHHGRRGGAGSRRGPQIDLLPG